MADDILMGALDQADTAWRDVDTAREAAIEADRGVETALSGEDVLITGYTTQRYEPLATDGGPEERIHWVREYAHVEAIRFNRSEEPVNDKLLVVRPDGSRWILKVTGNEIEPLPEGYPTDGSYVCATCEPPAIVKPDERHPHGCPVDDGEECASRSCNVLGSCQA